MALLSRLNTFIANTKARAAQVNAELDQLVTSHNAQETLLTNVISGVLTFAGIKTFSAFPVLPNSLPTTNQQASNKLYVDNSAPIGSVVGFMGNTEPNTLWKFLNGQAISRTEYAVLYQLLVDAAAQIGPGDGVTTFNLPDVREMFFMGRRGMGGTADRGIVTASGAGTLGEDGGSESKSIGRTNLPAGTLLRPYGDGVPSTLGLPAHIPGNNTAAGEIPGGVPLNILPPWMAVNYIIKVK
jgi:microcystin-dependent protein